MPKMAIDRPVTEDVRNFLFVPGFFLLLGTLSMLKFTLVAAPLSAIACLLVTVSKCYSLWYPVREPGSIFPAISALGIAYPQKLVYQSGFATVGVLLGVHIYIFRETILKPHFSKNHVLAKTADNCVWYGFQAAFGAALQGLYTLQVNMSLQNLLHWGGAILFMSGAMQHAQLSTDLYMKHGPEYEIEVLDIPEIRQIAYFRSLILKYSSVLMFAPMILGQIFFAGTNSTDNTEAETETSNGPAAPPSQEQQSPAMMNSMGLMQWVIILQFSVYFCSYAVDLWFIDRL